MLMANFKMPGYKGYDDHMEFQTTTQKQDIVLAQEFQKHLSNITQNNGVIDQGKYINTLVNGNGVSISIMFNKVMVFAT